MSRFGSRTRVSTYLSDWLPTGDEVTTLAQYLVVAGGGGGGTSSGRSPFGDPQNNGLAGGSGVVIIDAGVVAASTTGSPTLSGTIYTFTGSGSITF
jgi:hypothetical protein